MQFGLVTYGCGIIYLFRKRQNSTALNSTCVKTSLHTLCSFIRIVTWRQKVGFYDVHC
jgi:hypothetical protein